MKYFVVDNSYSASRFLEAMNLVDTQTFLCVFIYRPISITPVLSKAFERLIALRFGRFFGEIWGPAFSPVFIQEENGYL